MGRGGVAFDNVADLETRATFPDEGNCHSRLEVNDTDETAVDFVRVEIISAWAGDVGGVTREVWFNIQGRKVQDRVSGDAMDQPAAIKDVLPVFELPLNWNDNYGTRLRGCLVPLQASRNAWGEIEILLPDVEPIYWPHSTVKVGAAVFDFG
ncbi:MAG: hypothetical protein M2R45_03266 [Verrucomicrobia subdivision 3 bacterium]|nr:hypothetical protein [Limisphaerales bacterium]MCS1416127.1 hypothetical protein [Limisphaerales bacterium]